MKYLVQKDILWNHNFDHNSNFGKSELELHSKNLVLSQ